MYEDLVPIPNMCEVLTTVLLLCEVSVPILLMCEDMYQFFSCVKNWYMNQFFTCNINLYNSSWHIRGIGTNFFYMYQFFTPRNFEVASVYHSCVEYIKILHTSVMINLRNLSTNFRRPSIYRNWPYVKFTFGNFDELMGLLHFTGHYCNLRFVYARTYLEANQPLSYHVLYPRSPKSYLRLRWLTGVSLWRRPFLCETHKRS